VAADMPADAIALDIGSASRTVATRYDVAAGTLRTTDLQGGDAPNPLVSNVVNFKVQYGLDTDGDGVLDTWVEATAASGAGDWSSNAVLRASAESLARIKALRVGLIVRGEQFDRAATRSFDWVMFDCDAADKRNCPGRLAGSIAASARGGWHHRVYETVIPLRNLLWNRL
jgi:type IV pilus assembly protein PilW